jgi:hypothetical protein
MTISVKTIVLFAVFFTGLVGVNIAAPAKPPAEKPSPQDALEKRRMDLEERRLALEREKLTHEQEKSVRDFALEREKLRWTSVSISLSIIVPLILGVGAYGVQIWLHGANEKLQLKSKEDNERLQFKLKAAEIAMNSRDSNQVEAKARMLKALFGTELSGFDPSHFNPKEYAFSQSVESRERLLVLLAENPASREQIIRAWGIMFPWDGDHDWSTKKDPEKKSYRWLEKLQKDPLVNTNTPEKVEPEPQTEMKSDLGGNEDG